MGLTSALEIATSGLLAVNQQFAVISQNVANANSAGYSNESAPLEDVVAGNQPVGVLSGPAQLTIDTGVQAQLLAQTSVASNAGTTSTALAAIDQVMGTVGQSNDIGSLLGNVQSAFSTLLADPSSAVQQQAVVSAAQSLTGTINGIAGAITAGRQNAENDLQTSLGQLNTALAQIGTLNAEIVDLSAAGQGVANLQNQRNNAETTIAGLVAVRFISQSNGAVAIYTTGGTQLPTDGTQLTMSNATIGAASSYPAGGIGGITLNGADVTTTLSGGRIGADVTLRDATLPTLQAGLDEFSYTLATRFNAQGLALFTDPSGTVPSGGGTYAQSNYIGLSSIISVNPAVSANPSLVRDGTPGNQNTTAASGYAGLINNILTYGLGADSATGTAQPPPATTGLGATGTLSLSYGVSPTLADQAAAFTAASAAGASDASAASTDATTLQTALQTTLGQSAAVNVDAQMSTMIALQNSYAASAKMISAVQEMMQTVIDMIQ